MARKDPEARREYDRRRYQTDPVLREKQRERKATPEYREKSREYDRRRRQNPERREEERRRSQTPEGREKQRERAKRRRSTPEGRAKRRAETLRLRYDLTREQRHALYHAQDGRCSVCPSDALPQKLQVDHCHAAEAAGLPVIETVRGLLCNKHNLRLTRPASAKLLVGELPKGWTEDVAERARRYLRHWPAQRVLSRLLRHRAAA